MFSHDSIRRAARAFFNGAADLLLPSFFVWSLLLLGVSVVTGPIPNWLIGVMFSSAISMIALAVALFFASRCSGLRSEPVTIACSKLPSQPLCGRRADTGAAPEEAASGAAVTGGCNLCTGGDRLLRLRCATPGSCQNAAAWRAAQGDCRTACNDTCL